MDMNVVITAHHRLPAPPGSDPKFVEKTYGETTRPDLPKEVLTLMYKYTSILGYMERISNTSRQITVQPNSRLTAKTWIQFPEDKVSDDVFVATINAARKGIENV
jgi:hypothetical protein